MALIAGSRLESAARRRDEKLPEHGRTVAGGSRTIRVFEIGRHLPVVQPVVVIVHGAGDCSASWIYVQNQVAAFARVVRYDRGDVLQTSGTLSLGQLVAELHAVVGGRACVLVGHSFGGIVARAYAQRHPDLVRGLLLVDATPAPARNDAAVKLGMSASVLAARVLQTASPVGLTRLLLVNQMLPWYPEQAGFRATVTEADYRRWLADVCTVFRTGYAARELSAVLSVLRKEVDSAGRANPPRFGALPLGVLTSSAFGDKWVAWQRELAAESTSSFHWRTGTAAHNIHLRDPKLTVAAIREVLHRAASERATEPQAQTYSV
jgi:pimeloyl-ACP methyl ester carboxylesterase